MINLFKTYNKVKEVFVRPKLKFHFGLWKNTPGLPVWRRGPWLTLAKEGQYYLPESRNYVRDRKYEYETEHTTKYVYRILHHKLPKGSELGVWRRDIRKRLRKYGLGWLKPKYILPTWLAFHIFNYDVLYKWKYDTIRFEYPPQFTIVFFGIAFTVLLKPTLEDKYDSEEHYWESLLSYLYDEECERDIKKTVKYCGQWSSFESKECDYVKNFQLRKTHIKPKYHKDYDDAVQEYYYKIKEKNNGNT